MVVADWRADGALDTVGEEDALALGVAQEQDVQVLLRRAREGETVHVRRAAETHSKIRWQRT